MCRSTSQFYDLHVTVLVVFFIFLSACAQTEDTTGHHFRTVEEDGVSIALTTGRPKYDEELFTYTLIQTLKQSPNNPESLLMRPRHFISDNEGYFYVADSGNARIVVFDPEGNYVRSIGRRGNGPGEFQNIQIQYLYDSILYLFDSRNQRTTIYRTDGTFISVMSPKYGSVPLADYIVTPDDQRVHIHLGSMIQNKLRYNFFNVTIVSSAGDTIAQIKTSSVPTFYSFTIGNNRGFGQMEFTGNPVAQYHPEFGLMLTSGIEPVLEWYNLNGSLIRKTMLDIEPEPVTPEEKATVIRGADESLRRAYAAGINVEGAQAHRDALRIPDNKAFWSDCYLDDMGYSWCSIPEPYDDVLMYGGEKHRVFSPLGECLGNTRWPGVYGRVTSGLLMAFQENKATGEQILTVFRISSAIEGLNYPN